MKLVKKTSVQPFDKDEIEKISKKYNIYPEIIEILFMRNINSDEKIEQYLHPKMTDFYDPYLLDNMKEVVDKINKAI